MKKLLAAVILLPASLCVFAQTKPKTAAIKPGIPASIARGKVVYTKNCLSCHFVDGGGVPNMNPPLVKTSYVLGDKTKLIKVVLNGFAQNVEIDGETYSNNMAPHNFLSDQEIADVLTYVRNSFGNKASAVKAAEVKVVRAANKK
ncbi:cytochrome C [Mucilaginibacter sp. PPCGB 2223]|uniref:c-type cytochrome n=1 Tax=Mucilaginibacter sp. PPCGB 2223 TaxID=1886027 RepID=UPI000825ABDC|nr:cytochrome c [Mucilaginibacter sp. PPCGB 2223]OCX52340.1 cytochrome C [Mucilaginibacter sp. PPCGB 2223]